MCGFARFVCFFLLWNMATSAVSSVVVIGIENNALVAVLVGTINNQTVDALMARLRTLQGEAMQLNDHDKGSCEFALQMLTINYTSIESQLKSLQMTFDDQSQILQLIKQQRTQIEEDQIDIVRAIRNSQFKLAEEKLIRMGDMVDIPKIVQNVFGNSENNFVLVLDFARGLANFTHSFHVMKSLYDAVYINGVKDIGKLAVLAEALRSKVMILHNDPSTIKSDAVALFNELIDSIKTKATIFFIDAMKSDHYQRNAEVHTLAAAIYRLSPELSDVIMQRMVDSTYHSLDPNKILANIISHSLALQIIPAITKLFWNIKIFGNLNDAVVVRLASSLSKLKDRNDFPKMSKEWKDAYDKVVENLPTCPKNLFFEPYVCLWNKDKNSYLHAAESSLNDIEYRRYIVTSPASGNMPTGAAWFVENYGDKVLFKSTKFIDEYMYVAYEYDNTVRYVFNWTPGNNTDDQSAFRIELNGDHCYLRGMHHIEYLFASDVKFKDTSYTYAFTWRDGTTNGQSGFLWQIRTCVL